MAFLENSVRKTPKWPSDLVFFSRMGVVIVGTDSLHVHAYLNGPVTEEFLKELKSFLTNVTCLFFQ